MNWLEEQAHEFLSQNRIAVAGVSRAGKDAANLIYTKLKTTGHQVFAVNPRADKVEGDPCFPNLHAIPHGVDGVVAVTTPEVTDQLVGECIELGIKRIWMHRSLGNSVSGSAVAKCRENGISVIAGGCPMMFQPPVDFGHKCMKWWFGFTNVLPRGPKSEHPAAKI